MPAEQRAIKVGEGITADLLNSLIDEQRRWRKARGDGTIVVDCADSLTSPPLFRATAQSSSSSFYIQIGPANATFGGYPWNQVQFRQSLTLTNRGHDYTTASVSFSTTGTGATAPTATIDVKSDGTLSRPNVVTPGSKMATCTASISGDGSGATLDCILDQGQLLGGGWIRSGRTGGVGANDVFGHPTPGDLAYESSGCQHLIDSDTGTGDTWHSAVYPAVRDAGSGKLLFFCNSSFLARTKIISSYPTTANVFYGMETLFLVGGAPSEGSLGSTGGGGNTFYAYNIGSTAPPSGSLVICTVLPSNLGPFFAFRYDA